jgi:hypothetical protein
MPLRTATQVAQDEGVSKYQVSEALRSGLCQTLAEIGALVLADIGGDGYDGSVDEPEAVGA